MIISIHQPAYLPWLGYLDRISASDCFVFLDTVQFEKNSFINRNKIKTDNNSLLLTIPVKQTGHMEKTLLEIEIDETKNWRKKHLRSIELNYRKAPYFDQRYPKLCALLEKKTSNLSDLCFQQLLFWIEELGIKANVIRASELDAVGKKSDLILSICRQLNASKYLSGPQGVDYLDIKKFAANNIEVIFHDYVQPKYNQLHGDFIPAMSIVDYWLNDGSPSIFSTRSMV